MTELVVVRETDSTRKAMCLACEHVDVHVLQGEYDAKAMRVSPVDVFTCERVARQMPCQMARMLMDPAAQCPHPEAEHRVRWQAAQREAGGCGQGDIDRYDPFRDGKRLTQSQGPRGQATALRAYQ